MTKIKRLPTRKVRRKDGVVQRYHYRPKRKSVSIRKGSRRYERTLEDVLNEPTYAEQKDTRTKESIAAAGAKKRQQYRTEDLNRAERAEKLKNIYAAYRNLANSNADALQRAELIHNINIQTVNAKTARELTKEQIRGGKVNEELAKFKSDNKLIQEQIKNYNNAINKIKSEREFLQLQQQAYKIRQLLVQEQDDLKKLKRKLNRNFNLKIKPIKIKPIIIKPIKPVVL
jgi:hypothetical protein